MGIKAVNSPGPASDKNFVCDFFFVFKREVYG